MALEPAKLSDFRIGAALGVGTTARVYEATHVPSGRAVAIKTLEPSQHGSEARERFAREALLLAGVQSRHVGKILGFGFERGQPFLVLERLHGETLDAKLRREGPVPLVRAARWIEQLLVGVRDCHDAKVIHRDIKPSNVFLHLEGFEETVRLIDFGVARLREIADETGGLTGTNHLIGSMGYMAPEQFRSAKSVGFAADLYAVGVVIYRTLTGRLPFVSRSLEAIIRMKTEEVAPAVSDAPSGPKNVLLDAFVKKAMERVPAARFRSAREMLEQWWSVMASLGDDADEVGRVDESYAGPLHRGRPSRSANDEHEPTERRPPVDIDDLPPATLRVPAPPSSSAMPTVADAATDPFDIPTRNDPNLRRIVERELALHRKRNGE